MGHISNAGRAGLLALLVAACASTNTPEGPVLVPDETSDGAMMWHAVGDEACVSEDGGFFRRLNPPGRLTPRECVLRNLHSAGVTGRFDDVGRYADQLQGHYYLRSGRQQRFMDNGAAVTFTGALGAGLSGRVGAATQRAWLGVAFMPLLLTNVNANEPTRDLFHAGTLGLGLLSHRYDTMKSYVRTLTTVENSAIASPPPDCALAAETLRITSVWAQGDDRTALLPEAQRLLAGCLAVQADYQHTELTISALRALEQHWTSDFAQDVFELDRLLVYKDRQFRFSPSETIGAMAAAPFRTLDTFLSGQDTTQALKTMQTVVAFEDMTLSLAPMHLPARRDVTAPIALLDGAARARASAQTRAARQPSIDAVAGVVSVLERAGRDLNVAQNRQAYRSSLIAEFYGAAALRHLVFAFSASRGVVSVRLYETLPEPAADEEPTEPEE